MGRPRIDFQQHLKTVETLAALGLSKQEIAKSLGCSTRTFVRRLQDNPYVFLAYELGKKNRQNFGSDSATDPFLLSFSNRFTSQKTNCSTAQC